MGLHGSRTSGVCGTRVAFTLIELLVVVAIIALLMSILLPSLGSAREQARAVVCGQRQADFGRGLATYTTTNQDWIPGVNTSGVAVRALEITMAIEGTLDNPKLPTQHVDWMTPILSQNIELPAKRGDRLKQLLDAFRCASQREPSILWPSYDNVSQTPDYQYLASLKPWPSSSYMMPVWFQYFGNQHAGRVLGDVQFPGGVTGGRKINVITPSPSWEVAIERYMPKTTSLGPEGRKIFVADGSRYLDETQQPIDIDCRPIPKSGQPAVCYGIFADQGAWWTGSIAYGVSANSLTYSNQPVGYQARGEGRALPLSYRHGARAPNLSGAAQDNRGKINALFFDGHVERMSDRESREVTLWYPTGGKVKGPITEQMTAVPDGFVIP